MSIQTQIDRISESVSAALTALTEKGVTVPDGTKVDGLAALIAAIESGGGGGSGGNYEVMTFTPATTGISEWFGFDRIPLCIICIRKSFAYNDEYYTDNGETPFCATICSNYKNNGKQHIISFYNSSSSYFSGKAANSNSSINIAVNPSNNFPLCLRWENRIPCYFAFYTSNEGARGLRVGAEYTVIVSFREDVT